MGSDVLIAEAAKAGPIVLIMWLLMNRLERRVVALEKTFTDNATTQVQVQTLRERAAEDRQTAKEDRDACTAKIACMERELLAVWRKVGDRPEDKAS